MEEDDMTRDQLIRLETASFVQQRYHDINPKEPPFDLAKFVSNAKLSVPLFDEAMRAHIMSLGADKVSPEEQEALYTDHVYRVELLCRKIELLEDIGSRYERHFARHEFYFDELIKLRMFGIAGAIRGELQAMHKLILY